MTFENLELAKHYVESTNLIWPLLLDTERKLYRAYEMERGGFWSIFGPASWWGYLKLLFRGRKIKKPTDDVRQLGGDVLIDPEGEVRLHFVSKKPVDRPLISTILDLIP